MAKFKVLKYNENFMNWLGVRSYHLNEPINEFFSSFLPNYILLVSTVNAISSIVYTYMSWPQMEIISESIIVVLGCVEALGMFYSFGSKIKKIKAVHFGLQAIINEEGTS